MTTIAFNHWDSRMTKTKFSDMFDFLQYVSESFTRTDIVPAENVSPQIIKKMIETKSLPKSEFVNI